MPDYSLYGGSVTLTYAPEKHEYFCNGVRVPSVTQVTNCADKPWLRPWLIKRAGEVLQDIIKPEEEYDEIDIINLGRDLKSQLWGGNEADIGTLVHQWIEESFTTEQKLYPTNKEARHCCELFEQWFNDVKPDIQATETKVYSQEHGYAGILDLDVIPELGEFAGGQGIIDIKTSKDFYPEMGLQLSAYREAREEEGYGPYDFMGILLLPKYGKNYRFKIYDDSWDAFEGLLKYKRWRDGN
jgi:hypothetical protein